MERAITITSTTTGALPRASEERCVCVRMCMHADDFLLYLSLVVILFFW